jgi:hypothetical protein
MTKTKTTATARAKQPSSWGNQGIVPSSRSLTLTRQTREQMARIRERAIASREGKRP